MQEGDAGSVFAYNYAVDNYFGTSSTRSQNSWQQNDATHHSVGDHYELFEGFEGVGHMLDIGWQLRMVTQVRFGAQRKPLRRSTRSVVHCSAVRPPRGGHTS